MQQHINVNPHNLDTYQGNPAIKGPYQTYPYTQHEISEFEKCTKDPIYFAETYIKIRHVDRGLIDFKLYPFQKNMVRTFNNERFTICKLPRQSGKSTTSIAYILWYVLFNPEKNVGILANKGELAQEMLGRLQLAYENLPFFLQQGIVVYNKRSMHLENGSKILATASGGSAARGQSFSLLFLDEFAFVEPHVAEDFFRSVYPTISSGKDTKMIIVSTPKGMNHFYRMWKEAEEGRSSFSPIEIHWSDIPGRDEKWRDEQISNTSLEQFKQEFETEFIGSSNTLISPAKLQGMTHVKPIKSFENVDYYEEPKKGRVYAMAVDSARGLRLDYSAFVIMDISEVPYKVVAKYRSNVVDPISYAAFCTNIARHYNNAWVLVETNDVGAQVVDSMHREYEYEYLLRTYTQGRAGTILGTKQGAQLGVKVSTMVKAQGCANLKSLIEGSKLITEDFEIFQELTTFIKKDTSSGGNANTFAAEQGSHDDLVMCLVIFAWMATSQMFRELTDTFVRDNLWKDYIKENDDSMPIGFMPSDEMEKIIIDNDGTIWNIEEPEEEDDTQGIEKPDWYDDVYQNKW